MTKDIHKVPFDEGTKAKLAIFEDYLKEWLPVFLSKKEIIWDTINIYDFFSGPGSDLKDIKGTPLIIKDELEFYIESIITKRLKVNLYFNEFDPEKYKELQLKIIPKEGNSKPYTIEIDNLDFKKAFDKKYPEMLKRGCANLLFLDQNGIKHINEDVFQKIISLKQTDFLFFISSSTISRFSEHPNIIQHIKLNTVEIDKTPYYKIHRLVLEYYKSLIPINKEYYLAPFSLKKKSGVYGLIFGSGHVLGIEKFLTTCWKLDPERGEANFDIDDDRIIPGQLGLFTGTVKKPKKVDLFEEEVKNKILNKELKTDKDIYLYTLTNGFTIPSTKIILKKLVDEKKIAKSQLDLSSKICKANAILTEIKLL